MTIRYLGQWLLEKKYVDSKQLLKAINTQKTSFISLGDLAINSGLLSARQAKEINLLQRSQDKRFGEIAIDLKLLDDDQISKLLDEQKKRRRVLGETLVEQGAFSQENLEEYIEDYLAGQEAANIEQQSVISNLSQGPRVRSCLEACMVIFQRIAHKQLQLSSISQMPPEPGKYTHCVTQIYDEANGHSLSLAMNRSDVLELGEKILGKLFVESDELLEDTAKEFLNIVTGNACIKLDYLDIPASPQPPYMNSEFQPYDELVVFNLSSVDSELSLIVKTLKP